MMSVKGIIVIALSCILISLLITGCVDKNKNIERRIDEMTNKRNTEVVNYPKGLRVWMSSADGNVQLEEQKLPEVPFQNGDVVYNITVDQTKIYQEIDGFGASFTDASAYLMYNKLSEDTRKKVMEKLFDRNKGIGISFLRQPMGASDYALKIYSYDDVEEGDTDFDLQKFSIDHDKEYIIPLLKEALSINPNIKIMATPWSPPGWMKTSDSMIGGSLKPDCYEVYANYFVKFIKAYEAEGIPIYAVSVQNEPLYVPSEYPGMLMQAEEQARFIGEYLGPAFAKNGIKTKILCYDHNWDNTQYAVTVLSDPVAAKYIAGSAWHCYGGTHDAMSFIHEKFPDKDIWFTEASGGTWVPIYYPAFMDQMMHVIRSTRNWAKSVVWWNMALDEKNGPSVLSNSTCRGIITINQKDGSVRYNVDYYTLGHVSKFVKPGAYRIDSTSIQDVVETVAFKNPNGSIVLIINNRTKENKKLNITFEDNSFIYVIPESAALTFIWEQ